MTRTVNLEDLLSAQEAAEVAGVGGPYLRVLRARLNFPLPVRTHPNLWLRADVENWKQQRRVRGENR